MSALFLFDTIILGLTVLVILLSLSGSLKTARLSKLNLANAFLFIAGYSVIVCLSGDWRIHLAAWIAAIHLGNPEKS